MNEYKWQKSNIVSDAINLSELRRDGYGNQEGIIVAPEYIKELENLKLQLANKEYIECRDYIDKVYDSEQNKHFTAKKYFNTYYAKNFFYLVYNMLTDDENIEIENLLGILYKYNDRMINLCHPLTMLELMNTQNPKFMSTDFIIISYPKQYSEMEADEDKSSLFYDTMMKAIAVIVKGMNAAKNNQDIDDNLYIDFDKQDILQQNFMKDNCCVFPVDKMASVSLVPFYGWYYAIFKDSRFNGDKLISTVNVTGNVSNNKFCTGKLPANHEGLMSLRGNNLNSAYTKNCIDIKHNHSWVKANIRVTRTLLKEGLKNV